ncbi:MAG TPA: Na+/H+ antiporter [Candidatus Limnocylindrales bacterium]
MDVLTALIIELVVIAVLFEVARRLGLPYPALFVLGGLALGVVPGIPHITLEPDLVLLVFLPPLLFAAAFETPLRDLRTNLWPIARLSLGLVVLTTVVVAAVAQALVPGMGWAAAFALGAIVAPTDALAATSVFRRLGVPRVILSLIEGEALFNDASALILYRAAVAAVLSGTFVFSDAIGNFVVAGIGGIVLGFVVGRVMAEVVRWLDDPPVEVVVSILIPFLAFLPAEEFGLSGVLAVVTAGLVIGRRLGTILSPSSRLLWLTSWKMVTFVLNGLVFVLVGLALPDILAGPAMISPAQFIGLAILVCGAVIGTRFAWVFLSSLLPRSPRRLIADRDPALAWRLTFLVGWSGLRGAVSLAAALALPLDVPARNLILLLTFAVILATLVGQGLTLPAVVRWVHWDGVEAEADEVLLARTTMYQVGRGGIRLARGRWPDHQPLLDRLDAGLQYREEHLATEDMAESDEGSEDHLAHQEIQLSIINAQRGAIIALRDAGEINDATLRTLERELDLEELRMEA